MVKKIVFIFLIAIGIFFRVYAVEQIPGGLFGDEVSLAVNTKTIAQNGTDEYGNKFPFGFESFSDYKLPGYVYASVIPFDIFGPRILSIRFMAILSSIINIFLIGYAAYLLFPKRKDIFWYAMILLALSPYHMQFSRVAYETMLATTLLLGFFIAFLQSIKSKRKFLWFILGSFLLLGSCWTYPAPQFIIPAFLICTLLSVILFRPNDFPLRSTIFSSLGFLIIGGASFIPGLLNPALNKRTLGYVFSVNGTKSIVGGLSTKLLSVLASWFRSFNLEFLFDKGDIFAYRSGTKLAGVFLPIFLPAFFMSIFTYIKDFSRKQFSYVLLLILLFVCGLPSALTWSVPYGPRFLPMLIPLIILVALGWSALATYLSRFNQQKLLYIAAGVLLLYQIFYFADIYFVRFAILSQPEFVNATQELGTYLADWRKTNPNEYIYFLEGRSCASWRYDDLHFWYYANLPNTPMIAWDKKFRDERFATGNPFDAYDFLTHPTARFDHIVLYPTTVEMSYAPVGSLLVHCGISLKDLNLHTEHIEKIFYLYPWFNKNPEYIVTKKL